MRLHHLGSNKADRWSCVGLIVFACFLLSPPAEADNIDETSHFAFGENTGWINFKPSQGSGVMVCDRSLRGYAYGENIGWIKLDPTGGGVANDGRGHLSGYAWAENSGWINFAPASGGVTINTSTGMFYGYAWGENVGWINFTPVNGGVITAWRPSGIHGQESKRKCDKAMTASLDSVTSSSTATQVLTGNAILSWNLGPEPDLAGYKVYVGTQSGRYDYPGSPFTLGRVTSFSIDNLAGGKTYFFAISAYNASGSTSSLSSEVRKSVY